MQNIEERAQDDQDFLWNYSGIKTSAPNRKYDEGWERIFGKNKTSTGPKADVQPSDE